MRIAREEFGKGDEFCQKITYRSTGRKPEDLISDFRNSYHPRIAVTVDMIATGTDIKPLEDSANLPNPDVLAIEIVEDLRSALSQFESIVEELGGE